MILRGEDKRRYRGLNFARESNKSWPMNFGEETRILTLFASIYKIVFYSSIVKTGTSNEGILTLRRILKRVRYNKTIGLSYMEFARIRSWILKLVEKVTWLKIYKIKSL